MYVEGEWVWASRGDRIQHTNWYQGEPNNRHGGESCLALHAVTGHWVDTLLHDTIQFVCQKRYVLYHLLFSKSKSCIISYSAKVCLVSLLISNVLYHLLRSMSCIISYSANVCLVSSPTQQRYVLYHLLLSNVLYHLLLSKFYFALL